MNIYPDNLEDFLYKYPEYIPYKFLENDNLKLYRRYYSTNHDIFKVLEIFEYFGTEYYNILINNSMQAVIPYPVKDILYELSPDYKDIKNKNILNDNSYYTGAEIKYWFFINGINFKKHFTDIFTDIEQYIILNGNNELNDFELYEIEYSVKYRCCKIFSKKQIQEY